MEQTLNFLLKNHTYFSRNYDDESLLEEQTAITAGYPFTGSELHYTIPFWIGSIVISLLFLSAIIASIRYCFYTLYLSHT
ncbi:unnamed protein product, partial [Rotaria socialis]